MKRTTFLIVFVTAIYSVTCANSFSSFTTDVAKSLYEGMTRSNLETAAWSPLSIYAALTPLDQGADGETAHEFSNILKKAPGTDSYASFLISNDSSLSLKTLILISADRSLSPDYVQRVKAQNEFTRFQSVNFKGDLNTLAENVNAEVSGSTHGLINNLVTPQQFSPEMQLLLLNTVAFQGKWTHEFDKRLTRFGPFFGARGNVSVSMMNQRGPFDFVRVNWSDGKFASQVVRMHYNSDEKDLSLVLILPENMDAIPSILTEMPQRLLRLDFDVLEVDLIIPKLYVEAETPIQDALIKAGLKSLFTTSANLSRMTSSTSTPNVYVSKMIHKTVFRLDEQGTQAASATAGFLIPLSGFVGDTVRLTFDRPFVFAVVKDTDTIVFQGVVADLPAEKDEPSRTKDSSEQVSGELKGEPSMSKWWIHSSLPEYLTRSSTAKDSKFETETTTSRFQQPEPKAPDGIRFQIADHIKNHVLDMHRKNSTKQHGNKHIKLP